MKFAERQSEGGEITADENQTRDYSSSGGDDLINLPHLESHK